MNVFGRLFRRPRPAPPATTRRPRRGITQRQLENSILYEALTENPSLRKKAKQLIVDQWLAGLRRRQSLAGMVQDIRRDWLRDSPEAREFVIAAYRARLEQEADLDERRGALERMLESVVTVLEPLGQAGIRHREHQALAQLAATPVPPGGTGTGSAAMSASGGGGLLAVGSGAVMAGKVTWPALFETILAAPPEQAARDLAQVLTALESATAAQPVARRLITPLRDCCRRGDLSGLRARVQGLQQLPGWEAFVQDVLSEERTAWWQDTLHAFAALPPAAETAAAPGPAPAAANRAPAAPTNGTAAPSSETPQTG